MGLRIRPGWTLALILLIAFALQLIAVLSVPVTKKIFLCEFGDYQFGVFGYCNTKTGQCSSIGIGYDISSLDGSSFALPSNARKSLANLLIVHVVAAGLTLILLVFSLLTCIHGPANSSRYLLFVLIFSIPAFLISLLAFLVDILLFVSHLSWGGWIVLAATVLLALTGIILCVMRRSLSSRKAMRRRGNDDELADMSFPPAFQSPSHQQQPPLEDQFTELKYQNSTSVITATNTNDELEDSRYQHSYQPSVTESYRHANQRAFRGQSQSKQSLISHERQPEGQFPQRVPLGAPVELPPAPPAHAQLFPAGTYPGEDNVSTYNLPVGNNYGPNVVGIPRMRENLGEQHVAAAPMPPAHGQVEHPGEEYATGYAYAPDQQQQQQRPEIQEVAAQPQYGEAPASPHYSRPMNPPVQRPQRRVSGPRDLHDQQQAQAALQHSPRQSYVPPRRQWNGPQPQVHDDQRSRTSRNSRQSEYRPYFNENTGQEYEPSYSPEPQYQQPQSHQYQQHPQAYQPTRSEMIIGNNPDFQVAPAKTRRKGPAPIPQPVNAPAHGSSASSTSSNKRQSQIGGAPAAFATNDGPFAIARK